MAVTKTLLEMTQDILNDMDGDEINSISDTAEAEQVANIIKNTYRNMVSNSNWHHTRRAVAVTPYSDSNFPTHMRLNEEVKELILINYDRADVDDTRKLYKEVKYLEPDHFLRRLNNRNSDADNVVVVTDPSGIDLLIHNDTYPQYYTSFDDVTLVFDSYDSEVDTTLQQSKIQAMAFIIPEFTLSDSFVPDLPPDAFAYLVEEATSRCQYKLREFQDIKSEQESQKQARWLSRKSWRTSGGIRYPNYGKPTRTRTRQPRSCTSDKNHF